MTKELLTRLDEIQASIKKLQENAAKPFDLTEAADYLHVTKSHLYQLTSKSIISHYKPAGKKIFFDKSDLDEYIKRHRVSSNAEIETEVGQRVQELGSHYRRVQRVGVR
jgi:excisionase family DNA binding protein